MAKQDLIKQDGIITEALSNAMFRVRLENGHEMENCWAFNMILNLSRNEGEFNYAIEMRIAIIDLERD